MNKSTWKTWTPVAVKREDFVANRAWCRKNVGHGIETGWRWGTTAFPAGPFYFYFRDPAVATFFKISV